MANSEFDISVLILCYNASNYIEQCLNSILMQQTSKSVQIVIMDDESTDDSFEKVKEIETKYGNGPFVFESYRQPMNVGCYKNLIDGLKKCSGKYIAYLEGDDYWSSKTKIQDQWEFLNNNTQYSGIGMGCDFINESGQKIEKKWYNLNEEKVFKNKDLWGYPPFQTSSFMFRREALPPLPNYFKHTTTNDKILFVLLSLSSPLFYDPTVTTNYRYHSDNLTSNYSTVSNALIRPLHTNVLLLRYGGLKYLGVFIKSLWGFIVNLLRQTYNAIKQKLKA
ncbi:MAG: glycosyltransferase involved in cell wall biosynthesis [Bacteroidia bacterium]|jgi:glycosyltransferase involved in cell wall biosynthesis